MVSGEPIVTRIVVRRNQSLSSPGCVCFLAAGSALHLALALVAGLAGWWPVAGFVGATFLLMAGAVLGVRAAGRMREVITVGTRSLRVEYGRERPQAWVEMDRYWARVEQRSTPRPALVLRSRGVAVEVGRALTDAERRTLARRLGGLVGPGADIESAAAGTAAATG